MSAPDLHVPHPETFSELVTITPEMAVEWLERNVHNRKIRQNRVTLYADYMRRGTWPLTGETIKISAPDADGNVQILDGQHRLWACVEAGVPFDTYVVHNIQPAAMDHIDTGMPRTLGDAITLDTIDYANQRGTSARTILAWRDGIVHNKQKVALIGRDRVLEFVRENYDAQGDAIRTAGTIHRVSSGSVPAIAAFVFEIRRLNPVKAEEFIAKWINGDMLDAESPIRALRQWLIQRRMNGRRTETNLYLLVMSKAWNAFLVNAPMKKMMTRKDEDLPALHSGVAVRSSGAPQRD